jgi:hypothetical protein
MTSRTGSRGPAHITVGYSLAGTQEAVDQNTESTVSCGYHRKGYTVLRLRKMTALLVMALLASGVLSACGTSTAHLLSPDEIARQVGIYYGDAHAQIAGVMATEQDPPPHDPMYIIALTGHFQKGRLEASTLNFSALRTRMYVWGITARDQAGNEIWFDRELVSSSPAPSPSPSS